MKLVKEVIRHLNSVEYLCYKFAQPDLIHTSLFPTRDMVGDILDELFDIADEWEVQLIDDADR